MSHSTAIPCLRYRDAPSAIAWLTRVFGFHAQLVVPNDSGGVAHAQLVLGQGMVMLGSVQNDSAYGRALRQPDELGGAQTQTTYLVVADPDAVHERARLEGATIVIELKDEGYGGRGFSCLDAEGHLWSIGSYDPWA